MIVLKTGIIFVLNSVLVVVDPPQCLNYATDFLLNCEIPIWQLTYLSDMIYVRCSTVPCAAMPWRVNPRTSP